MNDLTVSLSVSKSIGSLPEKLAQWVYSHHPTLPKNLLGAKTDLEAVLNWLEEFRHSVHTFRAYEKESLRFLYWLNVTHQIALSEVRKNHIHQYRIFLLNPQPEQFWCNPPALRKKSRGTEQWKPFSGPLSYRSIQTAMSILQGLFDYLKNANYLSSNPFSLIKQKLTAAFDLEEQKIQLVERILSLEDFQLLLTGLEDLAQEKSTLWIARSRFILFFLSYMGLRVSEFVKARWDHLLFQNDRWWLVVTGKGMKVARVPVNSHCFQIISQFRAAMQLQPLNLENRDSHPLCMSLTSSGNVLWTKGLTERSIHLFCKEISQKATVHSYCPLQKIRLAKFSPHWLRHFSASMQALADIPFEMIKAHHRHSKDDTTRLYLHSDDRARQDWAENLNLTDMMEKNSLKNSLR